MEPCMYNPCILYSHINRQSSIQCPGQISLSMRPIQIKCNHLPRCVNTCICPPRHDYRALGPSQFGQGFFEFTLNRSWVCLSLASEKVCAIIGKSQFVTYHLASALSYKP